VNEHQDDGETRVDAKLRGRPDSPDASTGRPGPGWADDTGASTDTSRLEPEFDTRRGGTGGIGSRAGYGSSPVGSATADDPRQRVVASKLSVVRTLAERRTDAQISDQVADCIRGIPTLDASSVVVEVTSGVVRLIGSVATRREKWLVEDCSALAPNVLEVKSEISVTRRN